MDRTSLFALALCALLAAPAATAQSWLDRATDTLDQLRGGGGEAAPGAASALSDPEVARGLKEALEVAVRRTIDEVGVKGGFSADPDIRIPLPDTLERVQRALETVGMAGLADDLELRLNRAAEAAAPEAREVLGDAIREMTWDDARRILNGPDDAATQYFRRTMSDPLKERMRPIVDGQLDQVGALRLYDRVLGEYRSLPMVPDVQADLTGYTLDEALDGIFHYLGQEEARIRDDPAARTTDLLKKVFGG